jgi:hypothetical protein
MHAHISNTGAVDQAAHSFTVLCHDRQAQLCVYLRSATTVVITGLALFWTLILLQVVGLHVGLESKQAAENVCTAAAAVSTSNSQANIS